MVLYLPIPNDMYQRILFQDEGNVYAIDTNNLPENDLTTIEDILEKQINDHPDHHPLFQIHTFNSQIPNDINPHIDQQINLIFQHVIENRKILENIAACFNMLEMVLQEHAFKLGDILTDQRNNNAFIESKLRDIIKEYLHDDNKSNDKAIDIEGT